MFTEDSLPCPVFARCLLQSPLGQDCGSGQIEDYATGRAASLEAVQRGENPERSLPAPTLPLQPSQGALTLPSQHFGYPWDKRAVSLLRHPLSVPHGPSAPGDLSRACTDPGLVLPVLCSVPDTSALIQGETPSPFPQIWVVKQLSDPFPCGTKVADFKGLWDRGGTGVQLASRK